MNRQEQVFENFNKFKDETNERVAKGIENNRKGHFSIRFKDKNGNYLKDAKVKIKLAKHSFLHGANIFMLDEMESQEKNITYRDSFKEIFNQATLPFYWSDLEPVEGKPRFTKNSAKIYRRPAPDLCLEYCEQNKIMPKGHCLTYFEFHPDWLDHSDVKTVKLKLEKRYSDIAERYANRLNDWEVINETLCNNPFRLRDAFFKEPDLIEWNFNLAKKYFPNNKLIVNEASRYAWGYQFFAYSRSAYYQLIKAEIEKNNFIDCIAMQYHMFVSKEAEPLGVNDFYNPMHLFRVLDCYAEFGKPLQISEITIPAYTESAKDEDIQAKLIEQLYSIWFSHKSVEAITYWNLVDGYAAFAPMGDMSFGENIYRGGLMRFDLSKKPAYDMIKHLFSERWTTSLSAVTNEKGELNFQGFFGDYDIMIDETSLCANLDKNNKKIEFEI